jgi:glycyl-tRNA synthetase beta chain
MDTQEFLIEIGTEELPPKALSSLSKAFENGIKVGLKKALLSFSSTQRFATPRRLAVIVSGLMTKQEDKQFERVGPTIKAATDVDGNPTAAALGFAKSCGVDLKDLDSIEKDGVEKLAFSLNQSGKDTIGLLPSIVEQSLAELPIPKRMRWGSSRIEFVRPVHWLLMLFGPDSISCSMLGVNSQNKTYGHRFHHNQAIVIKSPAEYESLLENTGYVIADFNRRKELIRTLVTAEGTKLNASVVIDEALLDEVTGLVELPVALTGSFEEHFLTIPAEALILAMKSHQKCFYVVDQDSKLLPKFITVSNIKSNDPQQVIQGNERVIRPRLADARFFFETDKKFSLASRQEQLIKVVFQKKLGTVFQKMERVSTLAKFIANKLNANEDYCVRAALLSKCDLVTNMVGEFTDLQGLMGYYYALNDGEPEEVAIAINEQYLPRFSGDALPATMTGKILSLADKLDSMVGMFIIKQPPTGSKDPFALRRSAIGILRILVEEELDLDILDIIDRAILGFDNLEVEPSTKDLIFDFILDRFKNWYLDEGISSGVFQSVFSLKPTVPLDFNHRVLAVQHFSKLPESQALAAANKRVSNILAKQKIITEIKAVDPLLLKEPAEKALFRNINNKVLEVAPFFSSNNYRDGLESLVELKDSVDLFFGEVLVICDDAKLRNNRIALLQQLRSLFLQVADISHLHNS